MVSVNILYGEYKKKNHTTIKKAQFHTTNQACPNTCVRAIKGNPALHQLLDWPNIRASCSWH